jgi:hypothetical protein
MSNRKFVLLVSVLLLSGVAVILLPQTGWLDRPARPPLEPVARSNSQSPNKPRVEAPSLSKALGVAEEDLVEVGGIKRPKRDIAFVNSARQQGVDGIDAAVEAESKPDEFTKSLFRHPGSAPPVPADANPQVAGLYASLTDPEGPRAARSALFEPEPFDLEAYQKDPSAWLNQIRPGRVFEPAKPREGVGPIKNQSPIFHHIVQGERVNLAVKVSPGMPVTFYTPKVGEFPNRLTTHSVAADAEGIARTVYLAGPGTKGMVEIMAASPVHSGVLRYKVRVSLPD